MIDFNAAGETAEDLQALLNRVLHASIPSVCLGLSAIFGLLVVVGVLYTEGTLTSWLIVGSDAAAAVLFLAAGRAVKAGRASPANANAWGFVLGLIALGNAMLAYLLTREPFFLAYLPLISIGYGAFLLSVRWFVISQVTVVVGSVLCGVVSLQLQMQVLYAPILVASVFLSSLVQWVRRSGFVSAQAALREARAEAEQRQQAERKLAQSQRLDGLGKLVSSVAHDFNNLMMVVIGYSDTMLDSVPEGKLRDNLREIRKAGESAAAVAGKLLAFSRQQVLQPRVLALNDVVREARSLLSKSLTPDIQLVLALDETVGYVKVDPVQIEQVLLNLALNARDAMETHGGTLTVRTRPAVPAQSPPRVWLEVVDTGAGMSADVLNHAFEPFFTTKSQDRGTGLGLASVHGIVAQSGGTVEAASELGAGTTVRIELPAAPSPVDAQADHHPARASRVTGATVLVVDDDRHIIDVVAATLHGNGFRVIGAQSARAALELMEQERVDIVLSDIVMPEMNGLDFAQGLAERGFDQPVVFMSGDSGQAETVGGNAQLRFIGKPFRARELADLLGATLEDHALRAGGENSRAG